MIQQGPCKRGQWWIVQNHIPECRTVPKGCPADGRHVHWNKVDPLAVKKFKNSTALRKCWRLGTRGPCPVAYLLQLDSDTNTIDCKAKSLLTLPSIAVAPIRSTYAPLRRAKTWCPRGSQRDRHFKCLVWRTIEIVFESNKLSQSSLTPFAAVQHELGAIYKIRCKIIIY